ncbi:MAG TPA: peptide chain release factor N(5)-glutamine methyltransferase [Longimicrobiales bacterium]|nr:peptide chain release factor N(5)-glutamine methyltransferase [Longimicrobiales bacterium]
MPETALALAQKAAQLLRERGFENARLEAELLLAGVLGVKRLELYTQFDRPINDRELETFRAWVRRRLKHEPLQYITGDVQFRSLRLKVDRRALIPRPETEVLVGVVLEHLQRQTTSVPRVLDLGTGTGAIALAILAEHPAATAVATDVSLDALALAGENAALTGHTGRIELLHGDLWDAVPDERFDVVVSNPPYVAEREAADLAPEVREWEPGSALFAAADGLAVLERIVDGAAAHLQPGGLLALELGLGQAEAVAARIDATRAFETARITQDLAGRPRIVSAVRAPAEDNE